MARTTRLVRLGRSDPKNRWQAIAGNLVALGDSADEAVALLAVVGYEQALTEGLELDHAHDLGWALVEPLVADYRDWLEGDGELASDLYHRRLAELGFAG